MQSLTYLQFVRNLRTNRIIFSFNTRTGKGLRITRPGKRGGGQILTLPAISASIRARVTKLGKPKGTPVNFMVSNFGDLGSIFSRTNGVKLKKIWQFSAKGQTSVYSGPTRYPCIARIRSKQTYDSS